VPTTPDQVSAPVLSPADGTYTSNQVVSIKAGGLKR
jgi:hypothetical protein